MLKAEAINSGLHSCFFMNGSTWHCSHPTPPEGSVLEFDIVCGGRNAEDTWLSIFALWLQSLSHCELITDDGIRHLGNGACAHDQLEVIELDNCPLITDASLEHLKSCHSLERIELYDCQQITRAGIKRLRVKLHRYPPHPTLPSSLIFLSCLFIPFFRFRAS